LRRLNGTPHAAHAFDGKSAFFIIVAQQIRI